MDNKEFDRKLELRTKEFAVSIIKLSISLPLSQEGKVIKNQITKSGTSVGANYREANRARSRADFKNKVRISESKEVDSVLKEANELLAIFTSIGASLRK